MAHPLRFFVSKKNITNNRITIHGTDASHIMAVLRMKPGDEIFVLDGEGVRYRLKLDELSRKAVQGTIVAKESFQTESPCLIILGQALLKGNKFDEVVRKSVELGVASIIPLSTERTISNLMGKDIPSKNKRWQKIIWETAKQSGRSKIPEISKKLKSVNEFCVRNKNQDIKICFWEGEESMRLKDISRKKITSSAALLIGPEGGFSAKEIECARDYGFKTITLGPRILKAETAPLAALAILQHLWGDF